MLLVLATLALDSAWAVGPPELAVVIRMCEVAVVSRVLGVADSVLRSLR